MLFPFISRKVYDSQVLKNEILNNALFQKNEEIAENLGKIFEYQQKLSGLTLANDKLQKSIIETEDEKKEREYWENKYPRAKILYKCRYVPNEKTPISIPINILITPTDPLIIYDLKQWGLYRTGEDPETLVPKIYNKLKDTYVYKSDKSTWDAEEVWEFPFETRHKKVADCDGWSKVHASYYIAAGVPSWRVRCVTGNIYSGGMHDTVYVYSRVSKKFHHLNSTERVYPYDSIHSYPLHSDAEKGYDKMGIVKVTFSYNDQSGYYSFLTPTELSELSNFEVSMYGK